MDDGQVTPYTPKWLAPGREFWQSHINKLFAPVREWFVRAVAPQRGETILELGAGTGETGFALAAEIGTDGLLISSDISPQAVEGARRRGAALGLTNVEYRVLDAEKIDMDDDSVDAVVCSFAYIMVVDLAAAFREARRVLRPGGRVAFSAWTPIERNPLAFHTTAILVERGHASWPQPGVPGMFSMEQPERTRELLQATGFSEIHTEEVPVCSPFENFDELLSYLRDATPLGEGLRGLPDRETEAIRTKLISALAPFAREGGYALPGVTLTTVAS